MKARRQAAKEQAEPSASAGAGADDAAVVDDGEDINSGFGDWLRSPDGVAYMRLFVVANSLVMFMTISWPHITNVLEIIGEYFADWK